MRTPEPFFVAVLKTFKRDFQHVHKIHTGVYALKEKGQKGLYFVVSLRVALKKA